MIVAARGTVIVVAGTRGIIGDIDSAKVVMSALAGRVPDDRLAQ
jgi:hypothetical protein